MTNMPNFVQVSLFRDAIALQRILAMFYISSLLCTTLQYASALSSVSSSSSDEHGATSSSDAVYQNNISSQRTGSKRSFYELQSPHPIKRPAEALRFLADECDRLGIDSFDMYGDFGSYSTKNNQLGDSTYEDGSDSLTSMSYLRRFESEVAHEFGMADAVFMPSGVMAQSIALLINSDKKPTGKQRAFACHFSSHLLLHENEGFRELCGMNAIILPMDSTFSNSKIDNNHKSIRSISHKRENYKFNTGDDAGYVQNEYNQLSNGIHEPPLLFSNVESARTSSLCPLKDVSTLIIELPHRELGGKLTPWQDILKMKKLLSSSFNSDDDNENQQEDDRVTPSTTGSTNTIAFHCDGARIFEASVGYGLSLAELAKPFDSMYISFYKGLEGLAGAMLLGSTKEFCDEARIWLRRFGGNLHTMLPYAVSAWSGYQKYYKQEMLVSRDKAHSNSNDTDDKTSKLTRVLTFKEKKDKLVRIVTALSSSPVLSCFNKEDCEPSKTSKSTVSSSASLMGWPRKDTMLFDPLIPEVNMVHIYLRPNLNECLRIRDEIQAQYGICLFQRIREIANVSKVNRQQQYNSDYRCKLELSIGEGNGRIPDDIFIFGWTKFCEICRTTTST